MPIDWVAVSGMIFTLLLALVIGGFILMYPLTRRLGRLMEQRLEERREGALAAPEVLEELRTAVASLETEVSRLAERQAFMERLIEGGEPRRGLGAGGGADAAGGGAAVRPGAPGAPGGAGSPEREVL